MILRTYTIHCTNDDELKSHIEKIDNLFDNEMEALITDTHDLFIDKRDVVKVCGREDRYEYAIRYRVAEKAYGKSEVTTLLADKSDTTHNHDGDYKDIYWLPAWGDVSGKPSSFTPSAHTHDDRYYTESESNTRFSLSGHNHDGDYKDIYWLPAWGDVSGKPSSFTPS